MKTVSKMCGALIVLFGLAGGAGASPATGSLAIPSTAAGGAPALHLVSHDAPPPFAGPQVPPWAGPPWHHGRRWGGCDARGASWAIGRRANPWIIEEARHSARARSVRVIRPGHFYTQEYDRRRLNIEVNRRDRIIDVRCG